MGCEKESFTFIWEIENFSDCPSEFYSDWFVPKTEDDTETLFGRKFKLHFLLSGKPFSNRRYMVCALESQPCNGNGKCITRNWDMLNLPWVKFTLSFVKNCGTIEMFCTGIVYHTSEVKTFSENLKTKEDFLKIQSDYLSRNTGKIRCHMWSCATLSIPALMFKSCVTRSNVNHNIKVCSKIQVLMNDSVTEKTLYLSHKTDDFYFEAQIEIIKRGEIYNVSTENTYIRYHNATHLRPHNPLCVVYLHRDDNTEPSDTCWLLDKECFEDNFFWRFPTAVDSGNYLSLSEEFALQVELNISICTSICRSEKKVEVSKQDSSDLSRCSDVPSSLVSTAHGFNYVRSTVVLTKPPLKKSYSSVSNLKDSSLSPLPSQSSIKDESSCSVPGPSRLTNYPVSSDSSSNISEVPPNSKKLLSHNRNTAKNTKPVKGKSDERHHKEALWRMYNKKNQCDFALQVEGTAIHVHKSILRSASPILSTMLQGKVAEIPDMSIQTLEQFLKYLYCDILENMDFKSTAQLYSAAYTYQVDDLRSKCSSELKLMTSAENVCNVLELADEHQDEDLVSATKDYIFGNTRAIFGSDAWKRIKSERWQLSNNVMEEYYAILN